MERETLVQLGGSSPQTPLDHLIRLVLKRAVRKHLRIDATVPCAIDLLKKYTVQRLGHQESLRIPFDPNSRRHLRSHRVQYTKATDEDE